MKHTWIGSPSSAAYCDTCGRDYRDAHASECPGAKIVQRPDGSRAVECKMDWDGDVVREDGSINWAAAFGADDGVPPKGPVTP